MIPALGLEAVLSRVKVPEDFVECEVDGYSNCFEFIKTLQLGCPESRLSDANTDSPDECRDEADQFLTTFTWTCPTRNGLLSAPQLYMVELRTRVSRINRPRPVLSVRELSKGSLFRTRHPSEHILTKDMIRCHEMSCHCVGPFYLWGNFEYWKDRQIDGENYSLIHFALDPF